MAGRRSPYTAIGIRRVPCARCGGPSRYQWQCCANGNLWSGLCAPCDILLNELVLEFFGFADRAELLAAYRTRVEFMAALEAEGG